MTIRSYDGAEGCELVGLYLLNLLTNVFGKYNTSLYTDDGLSCFQNISGLDSQKIKKRMCKIFKGNGLNITVECNLAITDFVCYFSFKIWQLLSPQKTEKRYIVYIQLSDPPSTRKQIPSMISKQVSDMFVTVIILIKLCLITMLLSKKVVSMKI